VVAMPPKRGVYNAGSETTESLPLFRKLLFLLSGRSGTHIRLLERLRTQQHIVNDAEKAVTERYKRSLPSAARTEAAVKGAQCRILLVGCCPGALGQNTAKPLIAAVGTGGFANTSAFVIGGAEAGPRGQVGIGWELFHVRTNFGKNRSRRVCLDARDGLQQSMRFPELFRAEPDSDLAVQGFYLYLKEIEMPECVPQQKAMVVGKAIASQGGYQIRDLLFCLSLGKLRDFLRRHDTLQQSIDHQAPGESEHVTENVAELDIGILENLLNPIVLASLFPDQLFASASQIPEFPDRSVRNKARSDHAVAKEMGKPTAVIGVGFMASAVLDIIGVGQHDFNTVLQNVKDRFPVRTSALHHGMATAFADEPVAKKLQFGDDGSKFSNLGLGLVV